MEDKLSIIMPAYETYKYMENIVSSLSKQKRLYYPETELIIIDDGSEDELADIDQYGEWKVIHKLNGGVSSARNLGLEIATGKYIAFVDADDEVEPDYLHQIYKRIRNTDADYLVLNWFHGKGNTKGILHKQWNEWNLAVWGYVYKREIIGDERFDENLNVAEDVDWLRRVLKDREREEILKPLYRYCWGRNPYGLSQMFNSGALPVRKDEE